MNWHAILLLLVTPAVVLVLALGLMLRKQFRVVGLVLAGLVIAFWILMFSLLSPIH